MKIRPIFQECDVLDFLSVKLNSWPIGKCAKGHVVAHIENNLVWSVGFTYGPTLCQRVNEGVATSYTLVMLSSNVKFKGGILLLRCGRSWKISNNNKMKTIWQFTWQSFIHRFGTRHQHRVHALSISCSEHLFQIFDNMDIRDRKAHIKHAQELKWSLGTNSVSVRHYQARYLDAASYHFKWAKEVKL